jgi:hypothetical protein
MWCILNLLLKGLRISRSDGDKVLTMPLSRLHRGQVTDGSGSKILGWTALVIEEFFQLIRYVSH